MVKTTISLQFVQATTIISPIWCYKYSINIVILIVTIIVANSATIYTSSRQIVVGIG